MIILLLALQTIDHLDRDFTQEGLSPLSGDHVNVRIFTVTTLGEVLPNGAALEVRAKAVVVDGVVAGGPQPVVFAGGGMPAGRHPVLLAPPDGNLLAEPPLHTWYPASATPGLTYKLVVEGPGGPYVVSGLEQTSVGALALPNGEFTWRVEAASALGVFASETWGFVLASDVPPLGSGPITLVGDLDGDGITNDPTPTWLWNAVPGAASYEVSVYDTSGNPVPSAGGTTPATSFISGVPLGDGGYIVIVQPLDAAGNPVGSPLEAQFVVDPGEVEPGGTVTVVGDLNGNGITSDPTPTVTWPPVPGAGGYDVTIFDADGNPVASGSSPTPSFTVPSALPPGTYTVVAQPVDGSGNPAGDPTQGQFTVDPAEIELPAGSGPIALVGDPDGDGILSDPTPTFTWDPVPGADGYDVTILDGNGNPNGCAGGFTTETSWTVPDSCPLPDGAYTVIVQPVDGDGNPVGDPLVGAFVIEGGETQGGDGGDPVDPEEEEILVEFPFDDGSHLDGWETGGSDLKVTWAIDATPEGAPGGPYHRPPASLNYNNGADFRTPGSPNWGWVRSPAIERAGRRSLVLRFWCNYDTRDAGELVDHRWVRVLDAEGEPLLETLLSMAPGSREAGPCREPGVWHEHEIAMGRGRGPVRIEFSFDTIDEVDVALAGWFVDDIRVVALAGAGGGNDGGGDDGAEGTSHDPQGDVRDGGDGGDGAFCQMRLSAGPGAGLAGWIVLAIVLGFAARRRVRPARIGTQWGGSGRPRSARAERPQEQESIAGKVHFGRSRS